MLTIYLVPDDRTSAGAKDRADGAVAITIQAATEQGPERAADDRPGRSTRATITAVIAVITVTSIVARTRFIIIGSAVPNRLLVIIFVAIATMFAPVIVVVIVVRFVRIRMRFPYDAFVGKGGSRDGCEGAQSGNARQ